MIVRRRGRCHRPRGRVALAPRVAGAVGPRDGHARDRAARGCRGVHEGRRPDPRSTSRPPERSGAREAPRAGDDGSLRRERPARRGRVLPPLPGRSAALGDPRANAARDRPDPEGLLSVAGRKAGVRRRVRDRADLAHRPWSGSQADGPARPGGERPAGNDARAGREDRARDPRARALSGGPARRLPDRPARSHQRGIQEVRGRRGLPEAGLLEAAVRA